MIKRLKTARTLGLAQSAGYALDRFGLTSGHYRRSTPSRREQTALRLRPLWPLPEREALDDVLDEPARAALFEEVEEIIAGRARLFGGPPAPLALEPPGTLAHWTEYELGQTDWGVEDVKLLWEPARFGWVFPLGRAYRLNGDERCPAAFWRCFETFDRANPPNLGPNWTSAQEAALRLVGSSLPPLSLPGRRRAPPRGWSAWPNRLPSTPRASPSPCRMRAPSTTTTLSVKD